jgi:hypothetical protein
MTNEEFKEKAKAWIHHKLILAKNSEWYAVNPRKDAVFHVGNIFNAFLQFPKNYQVAQLALQIKKHEDLLMVILPIPNNPAYENTVSTLHDLLLKAWQIIEENNLQQLLK